MAQSKPGLTQTSNSHVIKWLFGTAPRNLWGAMGVLVVGLILTLFASFYFKANVEKAAQLEFDFACNEIQLNISDRLASNAQVLRSGAALFDSTQTVTRDIWRTFSRRLQIELQLPGIQGIGFSLVVPRYDLARHVQEIRGQGFPNYALRPAGERDVYSSIIYLEPFSDRNLRAFGFDMLSEGVRRAAMERARDENIPVLSGKVILVQETDKDIQAGTLMYAAVYRHGMPIDTVEQRRAAIFGWVYSPYRMNDLMQGTLRGWKEKQKNNQIDVHVYDGSDLSPANLLYDSDNRGSGHPTLDPPGQITRLIPLDIAGHHWTLSFSTVGGLASSAKYESVWLVVSGGSIISLLLFGLILSLLNTRANARRIAEQLSTELLESKIRYDLLAEQGGTVAWEIDPQGLYTYVSHVSISVWGYRPDELVGQKYFFDLHPEIGRAEFREAAMALISKKKEFLGLVNAVQTKEGPIVWVSTNGIPMLNADGTMRGYRGSDTDITDKRRAEEELKQIWDRLSLATRVANVGIWDYDVVGNKLVWDDRMFSLYGISRDQFSGAYEAWRDGLHPDDQRAGDDAIQLALRGEKDFHHEFRVVWPDGSIHHIRAYAIVQRDTAGTALHMIGTNWDVTSQKQANEALQEAVKENRSLLSELQHRVKNSFAMICSMISLASRANCSPETLSALGELDARVRSVSELYTLLYSSGSFTEVRLDEYCGRVADAIAVLSTNISLVTELEDMTVPVEKAASIGLILTELITNAFKYAFPDGRNGNITISLKKTVEGGTLEVRDDGIGLPAGFDHVENAGMGLRLVKAISGRIGGNFRMESDGSGTSCVMDVTPGKK